MKRELESSYRGGVLNCYVAVGGGAGVRLENLTILSTIQAPVLGFSDSLLAPIVEGLRLVAAPDYSVSTKVAFYSS